MKHHLCFGKRVLLLAGYLSVLASSDVFAQDIDSLRLFFTPSERAALPLHPHGGTATTSTELDAEPTERAVTSSLSMPDAKPEQVRSTASKTAAFTFNALISSRSGFSIVLNGLPCKPFASTDRQTGTALEVKLNQSCPHLETSKFKLLVDSRSRSLTVMQAGKLLGILGVGDSL